MHLSKIWLRAINLFIAKLYFTAKHKTLSRKSRNINTYHNDKSLKIKDLQDEFFDIDMHPTPTPVVNSRPVIANSKLLVQ